MIEYVNPEPSNLLLFTDQIDHMKRKLMLQFQLFRLNFITLKVVAIVFVQCNGDAEVIRSVECRAISINQVVPYKVPENEK